MVLANIDQCLLWDQSKFKGLIENLEEMKGTNKNKKWSEERKKHHAEVMRRYWDVRKMK